jgi:hypothetical protein
MRCDEKRKSHSHKTWFNGQNSYTSRRRLDTSLHASKLGLEHRHNRKWMRGMERCGVARARLINLPELLRLEKESGIWGVAAMRLILYVFQRLAVRITPSYMFFVL